MKRIILALLCAASLALPFAGAAAAEEKPPRVNMAEIVLKPECREAFLASVREEMRESLRVEPGVLALYMVADKNDENKLTFFEIYADDEAYAQHRETPHFKKYIETTKDMAVSKKVIQVVPLEMPVITVESTKLTK